MWGCVLQQLGGKAVLAGCVDFFPSNFDCNTGVNFCYPPLPLQLGYCSLEANSLGTSVVGEKWPRCFIGYTVVS